MSAALLALLLAGAGSVEPGAAPASGLSPAEAAEAKAESEALAAEHAAEVSAGLTATPAEVLGLALDDARHLGASSPLGTRVRAALFPPLGVELFCVDCPAPRRLWPPPGVEGLEAIDLRIARRRFDIPIVINDEVRELVTYFSAGPGRPHFERFLRRSGRFVPLMQEILESYGLPRDLVFVAMIESGFSTHAYSSASAVGPWQFMKATAGDFSLRIDAWVDERRDPVKATHAAARFLSWLHKEFDDWYLAWAGYNGGPGRVGRTIARVGESDYWALCRARQLPSETCRYVPKIVAAALVTRHPEAFGFDPAAPKDAPFEFEEVEVERPTSLKDVARVTGTSFEDLKMLNPELRRWVTPPMPRGAGAYRLRVPPGAAERYAARRAELRAVKASSVGRHTLAPGETLWGLAKRYGTTAAELQTLNGIDDPRTLRVGMELVVPGASGTASASTSSAGSRSAPDGTYAVQAGDSLWAIARSFGVSTADLCRWNGLTCGDHVELSVGQRLRIGAASASAPAPPRRPATGKRAVHVLAAGETLWQLSRRYGVTVEDLRRWNDIRDERSLSVGQRLFVAP